MHIAHFFITWLAIAPLSTSISLNVHSEQVQVRHGSSSKTTFPSQEGYFWTKRGGDYRTSSSVPYTAPTNFSQGPAWTWDNALDEQVRHSPLIDDKKNVYVMTTQRLRKFTPDGEISWIHPYPECKLTASPALHNGVIFLFCPSITDAHDLTMHALNMDNGGLMWTKNIQDTGFAASADSQSVFVHNGTVIIPMHDNNIGDTTFGGTNVWYAMNSSNGNYLWHHQADDVCWNAVPATPGDGTLLFSGSCGGASRITLGGQLLWRTGPAKKTPIKSCGNGGGAVGPNGVFYTEHTKDDMSGHISAYQISDGTLLWERNFGPQYQGNQYPAVGRLGIHGPLAVVAAIGNNPSFPPWMINMLNITEKSMEIPPTPLVNAVVAMDAFSGDVIWRWEEEPWNHVAAAGDDDAQAYKRLVENSPEGSICLPDLQGIPVIAGDGTVYASSSHGGDLSAIRDADGNGFIDPTEVSKLITHKAFLNSPSLAPGMLVAAPCWGPMYVFKA